MSMWDDADERAIVSLLEGRAGPRRRACRDARVRNRDARSWMPSSGDPAQHIRKLTLTAAATETRCPDPPHARRARDRCDLRTRFEQERRHLSRRPRQGDVVPGIFL